MGKTRHKKQDFLSYGRIYNLLKLSVVAVTRKGDFYRATVADCLDVAGCVVYRTSG